jgi:hypothetical protein
MPVTNSWNGGWTGEDKNLTIIRKLDYDTVIDMLGTERRRSWFHVWDDGWLACVEARVLKSGERAKKSDGFCGYDWMVDNIISFGATTKPGDTA